MNRTLLETLFPKEYHYLFDFKDYGDQTDLAMDEAAIQKRLWMIQVAEQCEFEYGLDLFAGVGYGTEIMCYHCENVIALENNKEKYSLLCENIEPMDSSVQLWCQNNLKFLKEYTGFGFDYIDFDPFNNANEQLQFLPSIFDDGLVWITSGEIQLIYRGLPGIPEFAKSTAQFYKGKKAVDWAENIYFPYISKTYNLTLVDFYVYPTSIRSLWTREKYKHVKLEGKRYLGWFKELKRKGLF